jgi:hypothetical protein
MNHPLPRRAISAALMQSHPPNFNMMKSILAAFLALCFAVATQAATLEGTIELKYTDSPFSKDNFKKEFGDLVKVTCNWHVGDFFGQETINAGIHVKNTGAKPMHFNFYVAFFDKDKKLVGATGQGSFSEGLKPGEEDQMGSCLIHLPKGRYKDVASFQAVIYETDEAPKKE